MTCAGSGGPGGSGNTGVYSVTPTTGAWAITLSTWGTTAAPFVAVSTWTQVQSSTIAVVGLNGAAVVVNGTMSVVGMSGGAVSVTGPLTDTQLRASAVPVSLPTVGSTFTAVGMGGQPVVVNGTMTVVGAAGAGVIVNGSTIAVVNQNGQSLSVTFPSAQSVNASLAAETTKVIGTVNVASGQSLALVAGSANVGTVNGSTVAVVGMNGSPIGVSLSSAVLPVSLSVSSGAAVGISQVYGVDLSTGPDGDHPVPVRNLRLEKLEEQNQILLAEIARLLRSLLDAAGRGYESNVPEIK